MGREREREGGMREEVISSGTVDPFALARSSSPPPTPAASSAGASSAAAPTNMPSIDWHGSAHGSKAGSLSCFGPQPIRTSLSTNAGGSSLGSSLPSCRPWERGDLLRRLATFKPSNWFAKPKAASSLACARRGWMNTDMDRIECESCGAQLKFNVLASWTTSEVDHAGEVFAEQLDAGHKVTCPWRGNCCADSLVQFPPTPPSALIGGYKDRYDGLLQFHSLPVIASSAVETMRLTRSSQTDRLLSQAHTFFSGELGCKADSTPGLEIPRDDSFWSHSHKLISLCGWEPRWLPNVQDCEENSAHSARNACSVDPTEDEFHHSHFPQLSKNAFLVSVKKDAGKKLKTAKESRCSMRSPLLDCSLCGATVRIWDFHTVPRPTCFGPNADTPDVGKKKSSTRGVSAASAINGWVAAEEMEKEQIEGCDEAATTDEGKSLSNAGVDLNLMMSGGLPSIQSGMPATSRHFDDGGMGRDLMIGQPTGSEVGDHAVSHESWGPSTRKRCLEEGGSTVDRPQDRIQQVDSVEGTVINHDGDEVGDGTQDSDGPHKRARGFDIFDTYHPSCRIDSSGAGPRHNLCFDIDIDVNKVYAFKEESDAAAGLPSTRDSAQASSVIAMDTIYHTPEEYSMESVENYPGDLDAVQFPSPSMQRNFDMKEALDLNYSNQAQQSTCIQPAAGSVAREMGGSSTNEGEEILNAETDTAYAKDRFSLGISGGSVGMGASHEAEIHGADVSVHRANSSVDDAEPIPEVTENLRQTGESARGPGLIDGYVPEETGRDDPHGDSQDMMSRSVGRADSGPKIYGSTKSDSVESGKKISHTLGQDSNANPSLSCNAIKHSNYEASKEEVTQTGKASATDDRTLLGSDYVPENGTANGENDYEAEAGEFDPIKHHSSYCPWVNRNVAAASSESDSGSSSSSTVALCGWQLTLDALDTFQSLGHVPNQTMQSESAASLYRLGCRRKEKQSMRFPIREERTTFVFRLCTMYSQ
ncbi:uncharacterized protein LOC120104082 isoform X2 [Phoenix dactylifera]|uniref:Uncharacterized protein LOC120104082 isoform X2 n=1 Tax=Phoenix dactylifera TaxID=42345 RepID=A0A8B8ZF49_PHODC|nr:uncharacterized protein LOC120104082 isoform X2 [Phoenix dactylifera]